MIRLSFGTPSQQQQKDVQVRREYFCFEKYSLFLCESLLSVLSMLQIVLLCLIVVAFAAPQLGYGGGFGSPIGGGYYPGGGGFGGGYPGFGGGYEGGFGGGGGHHHHHHGGHGGSGYYGNPYYG